MDSLLKRIRAFLSTLGGRLFALWRRYRLFSKRTQILIAAAVVILLVGVAFLVGNAQKAPEEGSSIRTVHTESLASLSGNGTGANVLGTVRSLTEAELFAQAGGAVTGVHTSVGAFVPAGFVLAELENSVQAAQVLSAQGTYEATLAAAQSVSPEQVKANALIAYQSAYASLDSILNTYVDTVFGVEQTFGPVLLIDSSTADPTRLSERRKALENRMNTWNLSPASLSMSDPGALLSEADSVARSVSTFVSDLAFIANARNSNATADQLSALSTARSSANTLLATLSSAIATYNSQSQANNASGNASVKQALGALRLAQASYEKTLIRAPIAGTVNFLPIRTGDYVSQLEHVATVAQNGALEIVASLSEENARALQVGSSVMIDAEYPGIVTSVAPALDPVTKQMEARFAVKGQTKLVNGQSVRITLPSTEPTGEKTAGPLLLPLSAVKLTAQSRVIFTVSDGRLVAVPVTIGDVRGERIEVTTSLKADTAIVTDARGLSEGERVQVAGVLQ